MSPKSLSIMVVEDDALLRKAITKKLELMEIGVVSCESGASAIDHLRDSVSLPSAIWLDYNLGDMTGLDVISFIKTNDRLSSIPVIVVSNSAGEDKVQHMLALGVKKYIVKAEFRLDEIINTIKELSTSYQ
ncbi:MAG: response regulator [Candidatus Roizmanbacteria bacterium]